MHLCNRNQLKTKLYCMKDGRSKEDTYHMLPLIHTLNDRDHLCSDKHGSMVDTLNLDYTEHLKY